MLFLPTHWLPRSKLPRFRTFEGSRRTSRGVARTSFALAVCVLWAFIEAAADKGLCGESDTRALSFVAPTEMESKIARSNALRDKSLVVPRVVETTLVGHKQNLKSGREKSDVLADRLKPIQQLDAAQGEAAQAPQCAPACEQRHALEHGQKCDSAEVLARALTSSLREELDAMRSATEAARIKQKQALDHERGRADALERELASLWAELDAARIAGFEDLKATEAERKQRQALEQERGRADALEGELVSVRAELDAARIAGFEDLQATEAERKQRQALEQERGRADALEGELVSVRAELDAARIAGSDAVQATEAERKQRQAFEQERGRADALEGELASVRAELDAARIIGQEVTPAAAAEVQQKQTMKRERDRAEALARELTSVRSELEAANRQIAALNALHALQSREPAVNSSPERMGEPPSSTTEEEALSGADLCGGRRFDPRTVAR
ncbi:uncharacterized protein YnzC (UPF0291/DUF896 family) [Bradyrhizobium sp. AZCC 1577]